MPTRPARFETHSTAGAGDILLTRRAAVVLDLPASDEDMPGERAARPGVHAVAPLRAPAAWGSARQWLLAACGVLGGAVVHLAWDAFTHEDGRGVRMVPELSGPLLSVHDHLVTGAFLLQGLSSLVGLVIVIAAIIFALRGSGHSAVVPRALTPVERCSWTLVFAIVTLALCIGFFVLAHIYGGPYPAGSGWAAGRWRCCVHWSWPPCWSAC